MTKRKKPCPAFIPRPYDPMENRATATGYTVITPIPVVEARVALEACIDRLKWVSEDSESTGFIESCKPVIAQAEAALKSLNP